MKVSSHRDFVSNLPPDTLNDLNNSRSDAAGLGHLAGHVALIVVFGVWIAQGWLFWPIVLVLQGIVLCFLFTLEHETTHKTPFASRGLNEWVGWFCGLVLCLPFQWFRHFHMAHHRYTHMPGKDPELSEDVRRSAAAWWWHVSGLPYWTGMIRQLFRNARGVDFEDYVPRKARLAVVREARIMLMLYAVLMVGSVFSTLLFWVWLLPVVLGQPFLRLYLLAEHGRCAFVANMFENTRTTYTNRLVRYLAWNMPYHTAHHTLPNVPFHKLPEVDLLMRDCTFVTTHGYGDVVREDLTGLARSQ